MTIALIELAITTQKRRSIEPNDFLYITLRVSSHRGQELISARADVDGNGALIFLRNKTGKPVVWLYAGDDGNGVVDTFNRKGDAAH